MTLTTKPPPPEGFHSWLEYAVRTFDGHHAALRFMFEAEPIEHHHLQAIVLDEFNALRRRASLAPVDAP